MFCTQCGAYNTDDSRFCHRCGHRLQPEHKIPTLDESAFQLDSPEQQEKIQQLLNDALAHEAEGRWHEAILACEGVLVLDPANTSAHSLLGLIYEKQGELQKAVAEYEKVVALNPDSVADRAKLEELRRRLRMPTPKPHHREPNQTPLLIGIFVTVGLFVLGLAAMNYQERPKPAQPQTQPSAQPSAGYTPYEWYAPTAPGYVQPTAPQAPSASQPVTPLQERPGERTSSGVRAERLPLPPLPPLTVAPPSQSATAHPQSERPQNNSGSTQPSTGGSVVMPDVPLQPGTSGQPAGRQPVMEITVRPGTGGGSGVVAPPPPSMESEDLMRVAQQHQLAGRYREAIPLYQKALQGATDKGFIYQQIGLCYQRLGELDSARNAYQQAIAEYERQIAANQNVERARRGLEAAKQGLAACGG